MMGDLERNVAGGENDLAGTVRVVTTEVGAEAILLPALPAFVERYPGLVVEIDVHPDTQDLLRAEPTLALRFQRPERGDFTIKRLGATRYRLYASNEFVDAWDIDPSAAVPSHLPYIGWASPLRDIKIARWLVRALPKGQPVARLSSLRAHVNSARAGIGVANLPDLMATQAPGLVPLTAPLEPVALSAWLVVPEQFRKSARVVAVANFVEEAFRAAQRPGA